MSLLAVRLRMRPLYNLVFCFPLLVSWQDRQSFYYHMIELNPQQEIMLRIEEEYDFIMQGLNVFSVLQLELHMRNIHILSAKYKAVCTG